MEYASQVGKALRTLCKYVLNKALHPLIMSSSVHWYRHMLRRENGNVLRRALQFVVEGQMQKGRPN